MKRGLIALILAATGVAASAQVLYDNPDNSAFFGARAGLDISSASQGYGRYSNGAGFSAGAVYNMPLYMNFYLEPGVKLFYDTFGESVLWLGSDRFMDGSIRNFGLRIPVSAGFHFDLTDVIKVSVFTGPQLNFSFSAREHVSNIGSWGFFNRGFRHTDLQWQFGAACTWNKWMVEVAGVPGLTRVVSTSFEKFRRNLFSLSIGYNF